MTPEKAIKGLKPFVDNEAYTGHFRDVSRTAIAALEKQIPKKPEKEAEDNLLCPACGGFLGYESECKEEPYQLPYCSGCGQAIDWEK